MTQADQHTQTVEEKEPTDDRTMGATPETQDQIRPAFFSAEKTTTAKQRTWESYTQIPLVIASLAYLIAYTWRVTGELHGDAYTVANWTMWVARSMFIVDYVVRLSLAKNRWRWFRTNLASLAWSLLPVLRLVLLLRIFTRMQGRHATPGDRMRIRIIVYGAGSAAILIYLSSLAVLDAERYASNATIKSFEEAIWWACVTVTTTGYGDYTPVTGAGRLIGVTLMFGGMALLGVTTAILGSLMMEIASRHANDNSAPATKGQIRALARELQRLNPSVESADNVAESNSADPDSSAATLSATTGPEAGTTSDPTSHSYSDVVPSQPASSDHEGALEDRQHRLCEQKLEREHAVKREELREGENKRQPDHEEEAG